MPGKRSNVEWFWACDNCREHAGMSLALVSCPGCSHIRCSLCPLESAKTSGSGSNLSNVGSSEAGLAAASRALGADHNHNLPDRSAPLTLEPTRPLEQPYVPVTTLSLSPSPEPGQPFRSSYSSGLFSLQSEPGDSATEPDSRNTESDDLAPDDARINVVLQMLDVHLVSVSKDDLDLAARLIPKIHNLLHRENDAGLITFSSSSHQHYTSQQGDEGYHGKRRASGGSSTTPDNRCQPSSSSQQKRGRGSGEGDRDRHGSNFKRHRRGSEENVAHTPNSDEGSERNFEEGPGDDSSVGNTEDGNNSPYRDPSNPDEPGGDPGEPSLTSPPDTPLNFACHFFKLDHVRYGPWTHNKYDKCPSTRMTELRRIKRHFNEAHRAPRHCKQCVLTFKNSKMLDEHYRSRLACRPAKGAAHLKDEIDDESWQEIENVLSKKGKKNIDDISRWYEIWRILFPGLREPSNPWNEAPGHFPRPVMDIEQRLSEFRRRIDEDIRKNLLPQDHQIPGRYLYHLRQLLKEDNAAHGIIQLQSTGTDSGEKINTSASFGSVPPIGATNQQTNFPRLGAWGFGFPSDPLYDDTRVAVQSTESCHSPSPFTSQMRVATTSFAELMHDPLDPTISLSTIDYQYQLSMGAKNALNENHLDQFWGCDFDSEGADMLKLSGLCQPDQPSVQSHIGPATSGECDPTTDLSDINPSSEDELTEDVLLPENTSLKAMEMWNNKHSGSSFLRRR